MNLLFSQNKFDNYQFNSISEATSKRAITSIVKDKNEFIWIGTDGSGLYRYDGLNYIAYNFDYTSSKGIISDFVKTLYLDSNNKLWVGTKEGLCYYDRNLDIFVHVNIKEAIENDYGQPASINSLIQDNNGNLIIGTYGFGLFKMDLQKLEITRVATDLLQKTDFQISSLSKSKSGVIYVGSNHGLFAVDNSYHATPIFKDKFQKSPISAPIESLQVDNRGFLWIGTTSNGLMRVKPDIDNYQFDIYPITQNKILSLIEVNPNFIFCGTENDGLIIVNEKGEVYQKYLYNIRQERGLKSNSIWALYEDNENIVWLGYYNKGLGTFNETNNKFHSIEALPNDENTLQASTVTSVVKNQSGKIIMSSEGGGIDIYDPEEKSIIQVNEENQFYYSGLDAKDIQTIFIDSRQNIWLGSWSRGIYLLRNGNDQFENFNIANTSGLKSNRILSFSEDSTGRIWIGTFSRGLHYYNPTEKDFFHVNMKASDGSDIDRALIRKVLVDSDNYLWIGTISGLYRLQLKSEKGTQLTAMQAEMVKAANNHNSIELILSIYESNDKTIWIGTDGAGLFSFDKKANSFLNYDSFPNLEEKSVRAIITDNNDNLWISGGNGLTKLDFKNRKSTNFTQEDGLLSNEFRNNAVYRDNKGYLYFGNYEGLNYFNPDEVLEVENDPHLYLADFKLFNKSVSLDDEDSPLTKVISQTKQITLNHDQSVFTIEYVGIDFKDTRKNKYAYYLKGFEDDWNHVGNNTSATYTNLEPGKYLFKLKSVGRNRDQESKILTLRITILPPWWKTYYAYFLYILLLGIFLFFIARLYKNRVKSKQAIILERERANQIEKLNSKKLQFFTNISHEFRTPLTLIINPLEDILKNEYEALSSSVYGKLKTIHKSSDRLARLINELMDFNTLKYNAVSLQVSEIEIVDFVRDIIDYFSEEASLRKIDISLETTAQELKDWLDPNMFEKIMFNLISNAIKFTPDGGTIKVKIVEQLNPEVVETKRNDSSISDFYAISVEDTGPGLDKKNLGKIFDRFYQINNLNKAYYGSTGIGLEVVKEFVELNKGKINVTSVLNQGTIFTVSFPKGKNKFKEDDFNDKPFQREHFIKNLELPPAKEVEPEADDNKTKKEYTVLIVEDNNELRNYLQNELKTTYKVIVAENGKKGYDLAVSKLPDIIITDVIMPKMNGLELCKNVKANIKISHIPILMLSAKAMVSHKVEGLDAGADIYLSKPFDMNILLSSLAQLIKSRQLIFNNLYTGVIKEGTQNTTSVDLKFIQKILLVINDNISKPELNVDFLASKIFLSRSQLYRKIKALTGVSVNEFIRNVRLERAKHLINSGDDNINEICYKVGFTSPSYFTKCFKLKFGHLPTQNKSLSEE
ncbi:two-component regulator propeller domain-containing protein [Marivirga arenosa]|uniref:histidine kinase n=1 Tax=Marivirga arenosa TaxID=3059076 RepID=A0AA51N5Y2_9BACT|nr:two-component regulator propeller domain-containing protein [Marivirga sp. ABR2-2]WMN06926.1 two-component regulator propeller domain-containing protein [Marivirga sp. ABR2-2]